MGGEDVPRAEAVGLENSVVDLLADPSHRATVSDQHKPLRADERCHTLTESHRAVLAINAGDISEDPESGEVGVDVVALDSADVLHRHPIDSIDLAHHEVDETDVGKQDDELVDDAASTGLEHLDSEDVAPDRADPAGHLTEGSGAIG